VSSTYNPQTGQSPVPTEIWVAGNIANLGGKVTIRAPYGSIRVEDGVDVRAQTLSITAGKDITIGYKEGYRALHDARNGYSVRQGLWDARESGALDSVVEGFQDGIGLEPPSLMAQNVYMAAQYLNINGVIQAGFPRWGVTIKDDEATRGRIQDFKTYGSAASKDQLTLLARDEKPTNKTLSVPFVHADWLGDNPKLGTAERAGTLKEQIDEEQDDDGNGTYCELDNINDDPQTWDSANDLSQLAVYYDPESDGLETEPVDISGGHMDLFGHILNTSAGELRVLDGYGCIEITNNTDIPLRLKALNTGGDIEGTIKITDTAKRNIIDGEDAGPLVTEYKRSGGVVSQYDNYGQTDPDAETQLRKTFLDPESDRPYYQPHENHYATFGITEASKKVPQNTTLYEKGFTEDPEYKYSTGASDCMEEFAVSTSPAYKETVREYTGSELYLHDQISIFSYMGWQDGGEPPLVKHTIFGYPDDYLYYTKERERTRTVGDRSFDSHSFYASNPINIAFMGSDEGTLTVSSPAGLIIDGVIRNTSGTTNLKARGESGVTPGGAAPTNAGANGMIIMGSSPLACIQAQNLTLNARGDIGSITTDAGGVLTDASPVRLDLLDDDDGNVTGWVSADSTHGSIALAETHGALQYEGITASNGDVLLIGDTDIDQKSGVTTPILGDRVTLQAQTGAIGANSGEGGVRINTSPTAQGGLVTSAAGDIFITETEGDLWLVSASSPSNVTITAAKGSIIDNEPTATVDEAAVEKFEQHWDDMLLGEGAQDSAEQRVEAHEQLKTSEYNTYWRYRSQQDDDGKAYDESFQVTYSEGERAYFRDTLGWSDGKIEQRESDMTAEYHGLHDEYGSVTTAYDKDRSYVVEQGSDEWNSLTEGCFWTLDELTNRIGAGLLLEASDTELVIEEPNVSGQNLTLRAPHGAVGSRRDEVTIEHETKLSELTQQQRLALLTAEYSDLEIEPETKIHIIQREDVDL